MKTHISELEINSESEEFNWFFLSLAKAWQKAVVAIDWVWWFVVEAEVVRHISPDLPPERVDSSELSKWERNLGPWA